MRNHYLNRVPFLLLALLAPVLCQAAVVDVSPSQLPAYLKSHSSVVVLFTSPDTGCDYCMGAEVPFEAVSREVGTRASFVRVQWAPWRKPPPGIHALGVTGIPSQFAYQQGRRVDILLGKIKDPAGYAKKLDTVFPLPH